MGLAVVQEVAISEGVMHLLFPTVVGLGWSW